MFPVEMRLDKVGFDVIHNKLYLHLPQAKLEGLVYINKLHYCLQKIL